MSLSQTTKLHTVIATNLNPCVWDKTFFQLQHLFSNPLVQPGSRPALELLFGFPRPLALFCLGWLQKACMCVCWILTAGSGWGHKCKPYWGHSAILSSWPRLWVCAPRTENNNAPQARSNTEKSVCVFVCMCMLGGVGHLVKLSSQQLIGWRWGCFCKSAHKKERTMLLTL